MFCDSAAVLLLFAVTTFLHVSRRLGILMVLETL